MPSFQLAQPFGINGRQLSQEIEAATGLDVSDAYAFIEPQTVVVDGVEGSEAAIQAVIDAHVPVTVRRVYPKREFVNARLTMEERRAIRSSPVQEVQDLWEEFMMADIVDLDNEDLIAGFLALEVIFELLAEGRAAEILDPSGP